MERELVTFSSPKHAIILAAGYGMRMVPINAEFSKGLLEIHGEAIIERQIKFLNEVGITDIYVVVGFMKEQYEYLMDEYGVELIVNSDYKEKNNLYSLYKVADHIEDTYIVPCDVWCKTNPFRKEETHSWYMVNNLVDDDSDVRLNRKGELIKVAHGNAGNSMVGIAYITYDVVHILQEHIVQMVQNPQYDHAFWEEALYGENGKMLCMAKVVDANDMIEINTYEQLREVDSCSNQLKSDAIDCIKEVFSVNNEEITDITVLKKGMTNRSFLFRCRDERYIMRIPGEGTSQLINRKKECDVYEVIKNSHISDTLIFINPDSGYKITKYIEDAKVCDPMNSEDVCRCMGKLRQFHEMRLQVGHEFDLFGHIEFYESLWNGNKSVYRDYERTKENILQLKLFIDRQEKEYVLTHIDAVPDNFLIANGDIRLIDWEYSGMQDPHLDIAMFAIYAMYDREHVEQLIGAYFPEGCEEGTRIKIHCYIACAGLLWSNWCEYKRMLGVEFGEYSLRQYRYAKEYYKIAAKELGLSEVKE